MVRKSRERWHGSSPEGPQGVALLALGAQHAPDATDLGLAPHQRPADALASSAFARSTSAVSRFLVSAFCSFSALLMVRRRRRAAGSVALGAGLYRNSGDRQSIEASRLFDAPKAPTAEPKEVRDGEGAPEANTLTHLTSSILTLR